MTKGTLKFEGRNSETERRKKRGGMLRSESRKFRKEFGGKGLGSRRTGRGWEQPTAEGIQ